MCEYPGCTKAFSNASDRAKHQNRTHSNAVSIRNAKPLPPAIVIQYQISAITRVSEVIQIMLGSINNSVTLHASVLLIIPECLEL